MSRKVREIGEFPKGKKWGDNYYCEICTKSDRSSDYSFRKLSLGYGLIQCLACGRWVCLNCWDEKTGLCKICSKSVSNSSDSLTSKIKQLERRISALEKIIHTCPNCGALIVNPKAKFCGVCGERIS